MILTDVAQLTNASRQRTRYQYFELIVLMGVLQAFAPLSIDMYLPSMPLLEKVFGATTAQVQITLVTFLLGFALGQSLYGPVTDRFGRKPPLYVSLTLFVISSAACALSKSVNALAVFRLLQAIGACGGAVVSRAMVRDLFPPVDLRRIFSMLVLVLGVSPLIAPFIGGYLLVWFGWKSIFYTQASLGALTLVAMHFRLGESMPPEHARPLRMVHVISSYAHLLRDRTFLGASLVCGFSSAGMFAYIASAPFVFINIYKLPPQQFGWLFGFIAAGLIGASQVNGRMSHRIALWRVLRTANLVQLASGFAVLATALTGFGGLIGIFAPVFVYMCATGFVFPNGNAIAMMRHGNMAGTASALLGTNQFVIAAATTIVLGIIDNSSALPMAIVIAGCGAAATLLNYLTLGAKLDVAPPALVGTAG
jgi:DHA1 family bicyclomycin/chloramphenicol resistance-like MFS transporter